MRIKRLMSLNPADISWECVFTLVFSFDKNKVSDVDKSAASLTQDKDRVPYMDSIGKKNQPAQQAEIPERNGNGAFTFSFGHYPLNQESHKKCRLAQKAKNNPATYCHCLCSSIL